MVLAQLIDGGEWGAYNSACAAALAVTDFTVEMTADERSRVRELARTWLAHETERWKAWTAEDGERAAEARRRLHHALQDPDFASVRGDALVDLPVAERAAWEVLWSSIEQAAQGDG